MQHRSFRKVIKILIILWLAIALYVFIYHIKSSRIVFITGLSELSSTTHKRPTTRLNDNINIIDTSKSVNNNNNNNNLNSTFPCTQARISNLSFPVCTYEITEDYRISGAFLTGDYWDKPAVKYLMDCLNNDPDLQFIDLGANIGSYTLAVAHMKRKVLAVEPNRESVRRMSESIYLGHISGYITLLNNAVSDEHRALSMAQDLTHRGKNVVLSDRKCNDSQIEIGSICVSHTVNTITLDDLVPLMTSRKAILKIDIEGHEIKALTAKGTSEFFKTIHVPIISMEFEWYKKRYREKRELVYDWFEYFYELNYTVHNRETQELLPRKPKNWKNWPFDIVLKLNR